MSGHNACTVLAGNPVRVSGLFFDTHNKLSNLWTTIHISCVGHPRIAQDFIDDMKARYGEDSNDYRVRVLGEFPLSNADTVIPYELMALALTRDVRPLMVKPVWGLDCAGQGSDKSALCKRQGNVIIEPVIEWKGLDTMELVGRVHLAYKATPALTQPNEIAVDAIGLGAGVADRLMEMGLPARGVNVSETAALSDKYRNVRAELAFTAREWFEKRDVNIANDSRLGAELVDIRYKPTSTGKIQIESKDDMRRRGVKSPNLADAFFLTFAADATAALYGSKNSKTWKEALTRTIKGIV
jgi:phage terminase large subunit